MAHLGFVCRTPVDHHRILSRQPRVWLHLDGGAVPRLHGRALHGPRHSQRDPPRHAYPPGARLAAHGHAGPGARDPDRAAHGRVLPGGPPRVAATLRGGGSRALLHSRVWILCVHPFLRVRLRVPPSPLHILRDADGWSVHGAVQAGHLPEGKRRGGQGGAGEVREGAERGWRRGVHRLVQLGVGQAVVHQHRAGVSALLQGPASGGLVVVRRVEGP
mmetsp:Transcript_103955/g.299311  ORF Transcript_103955/g.299311 Transcript_103955/m.299311 type:complete len:217 (-) Transcript_103955:885-1535(-)